MADPIASARALQPTLRKRADEIEAARRLPADLSAEFASAGFYRLCVPEVYGGLELPPMTTMETIETLAAADGSAAWCVFIAATSGTVLALLPEDGAREVFPHEKALLGGVFAPRGEAHQTDEGFRVNGRWQWGSGTQNADWVMGGCRIFEGGKPAVDKNGAPLARMMIVPAADVTFHDTWYVSGLSGTGSTDFEFADVFVPNRHAVGLGVDRPLERPLYAFPQFGLLAMGIAAVALGLARAAIDELIDLAGGKTPAASSRPLAARQSAQMEVALAEAERRSARAFFYETIEAAWEMAQREGRIGVDERRDVRLATTHAVRASASAVDRMYHLAGGTSVYRTSPLQRIFRDVHVTTQHMMVAPSTFELTGRLLLGLETHTGQL